MLSPNKTALSAQMQGALQDEGRVIAVRMSGEVRTFELTWLAELWLDDEVVHHAGLVPEEPRTP